MLTLMRIRSGFGSSFSVLCGSIRIPLPKTLRIRIRNPVYCIFSIIYFEYECVFSYKGSAPPGIAETRTQPSCYRLYDSESFFLILVMNLEEL
jgi:hypothetical protein